MIKNKTLHTLEFDKILQKLKSKAEAEKTREIIENIIPSTSYKGCLLLQNETAEAYKILYTFALNPVLSVDNIEYILVQAKKMSILSMADLLKIARVLRVANNLKTTIFKAPHEEIPIIKSYTDRIYTNNNLEKDIESSIISETEMSDNASRNLKLIRDNIKKQNEKIRQKLNSYISSSTYQKALQDNIITIRKDRYVLPVKSEYKHMIDGIIHDQSSSGATYYIEPMAIVNINNEIVSLKLQEQAEITKILQAFTTIISGESDILQQNFDIITALDLIFSRAKLGKELKCNSPILNNEGRINIIQGKHPLIDKDKVIPININLGIDFDMLLITGPNTGGKTVTLKLVGLFTLMAMSGLMIPFREGSELSFFENVACDIGDEQSIEQSLSTFSSHLKNIVEITENCNNSLILFDELGAGTDPSEGAALATAISEYLLTKNCKSIITSHYNELKEFSMITNRVENASMDFNPITYEPIYKLIIGVAGQSNALQIAKRLGLNKDIIDNANSKISNEKKEFDNIIMSAHKTKKEAEFYLEKILKDRDEEEKLLHEIKIERANIAKTQEELNNKIRKTSKELIEDSVDEANDIIDKMKNLLKNPTEQNIFTARKMRKQLENMSVKYEDKVEADYTEDTSYPISVGSTVLLKSLGKQGIVESINQKNMVRLRLGNIMLDVKMCDIVKIKTDNKKKKKQTVNISKQFSNETVSQEINVIGKTVDEAIIEVDDWIDKASLVGLSELRVIHGKGTGALRKGLQEHFKKHKQIKTFRNGRYGEGEMGATILTLK